MLETARRLALENVGLKVFSFVAALGVYAFVHGAENARRTFAVSVVSVQPPDSAKRQLLTGLPTEIAVTLRGSRTQLDDLRADDLGSLQLDVHTGRESRIVLGEGMLRVPPGTEILDFNPHEIDLRWDDVVSRPIRVQLPRTGELPAGYVVRSSSIQPEEVVGRGPRSVIESMQLVRVAPFEVSGLGIGVHRRPLALDAPPKHVTFDVPSVTATLEIARELRERDFLNRKVEVVGLSRATTTPATVIVKFIGTSESLASLAPDAVVPRVEPRAKEGSDLSHPGSQMCDVIVDVGAKDDAQAPKAVVQPAKVLVKW